MFVPRGTHNGSINNSVLHLWYVYFYVCVCVWMRLTLFSMSYKISTVSDCRVVCNSQCIIVLKGIYLKIDVIYDRHNGINNMYQHTRTWFSWSDFTQRKEIRCLMQDSIEIADRRSFLTHLSLLGSGEGKYVASSGVRPNYS